MRNKIYKSIFLLFFIQLLVLESLSAQQGRIGIGTTTPNVSLEIKSNPTNTQEITGFIPPRLTRAELTAKGNALYGTAQNGTLVYITDITGGDMLNQRQLIDNIGYYYFDAPNNIWQKMSSVLPTDNEGWNIENSYLVTATNFVDINGSANSVIAADIPGMVVNIPIPAGKEAKILVNYSTPLGAFVNVFPMSGYYGTRVLRNNIKLPYASKKVSPVLPNNGATYGMKTITETFVDYLPATPTTQTYTYKLQGFSQNAPGFVLRAGMFSTSAPNYNWGRASWFFIVYIR